MNIIKNEIPKLKKPKFKCDVKLCKELDYDPLLKYMKKI